MYPGRQLIIASGLLVLCHLSDVHGDSIPASVVKIHVTVRRPNLTQPWTKESPQDVTGSGLVIEGNRIITNAHVVAYASQIYVQPYQSAEKLVAKVTHVAPGVDLALLELEEVDFFNDHPPLDLTEKLPRIKDKVSVYGYPLGGNDLSVTEGIVSRIEYAQMYYGTSSLRIQVDAALNSGNSGGPALVDGKVVGVVFSRILNADNIGYLVPTEEVRLFLKDIEDGSYGGPFNLKLVGMQSAENQALRDKLGMTVEQTGMMVTDVRGSQEQPFLKRWDVVTHVGSENIDNEGFVSIDNELRLNFRYFVARQAKDGQIQLTVLRDGKAQTLQVPVQSEVDQLIRSLKLDRPNYFIYGPLVFTPVVSAHLGLNNPRLQLLLRAKNSPIITRSYDLVSFPGEQLVAIGAPMFPHRITKTYDQPIMNIVTHVNEIKIKNLHHLAKTLLSCQDEFVTFQFEGQSAEIMVFRRSEIEAATEDILSDNGIRNQFSDDLEEVFQAAGQ